MSGEITELQRILETLPESERSAFLHARLQNDQALAEIAIRRAEAESKRAEAESKRAEAETKQAEATTRHAEFLSSLSSDELARYEAILEYSRVTEEKKAERNRKLADLRRATLEDMKTRSFKDVIFLLAAVVAISGMIKAYRDVCSAENAAKTGVVSLYALIGVVVSAGFKFIDGQAALISRIHAGQTQLVSYIDIESGGADVNDLVALLEEDRKGNQSYGIVEILDRMKSQSTSGLASIGRGVTAGTTVVRRRFSREGLHQATL